jgi:hypothetical protein
MSSVVLELACGYLGLYLFTLFYLFTPSLLLVHTLILLAEGCESLNRKQQDELNLSTLRYMYSSHVNAESRIFTKCCYYSTSNRGNQLLWVVTAEPCDCYSTSGQSLDCDENSRSVIQYAPLSFCQGGVILNHSHTLRQYQYSTICQTRRCNQLKPFQLMPHLLVTLLEKSQVSHHKAVFRGPRQQWAEAGWSWSWSWSCL